MYFADMIAMFIRCSPMLWCDRTMYQRR